MRRGLVVLEMRGIWRHVLGRMRRWHASGRVVRWTCVGGWCEKRACRPVCGDGIVIAGREQCDDGNWWAYNGCSGSCTVDCGWDCSGGRCTGICGDGMRNGAEGCDDGNTALGDGCSFECNV
jgi:cysteine-rich repeat protein